MATSTSNPVNVNLTPDETFIALIVLGGFAAFLGYAPQHYIPSWVGLSGIYSVVILAFGYLAHEYVPTTWVTYLTLAVLTAILGEVANLQGQTGTLTVVVLTGLIGVLSAIYHNVSLNGGSYFTAQQETIATAITGGGVAFLGMLLSQANADGGVLTIAAVLSTLFVVIPQFVHVTAEGAPPTSTPVATVST
jgi:hypothetical protein